MTNPHELDLNLDPYLKRHRLELFEQHAAQHSYAYGVDIRRSRWLARVSVGHTLLRAVDRAWPRVSDRLQEELLETPDADVHPETLAILDRSRARLGAPRPTIWLIRPKAAADASWPPVTPLAPTRGGARCLLLDDRALQNMEPKTRRFWLASGVAHLQCGHGVFYLAHLLLKLGRAPKSAFLLRQLLAPWNRVMAFSSDRAGRLASHNLPEALDALSALTKREEQLSWLPKVPRVQLRRAALEDFEHTAVVARIRAAQNNSKLPEINTLDSPPAPSQATHPSKPSISHVPKEAWSLARCDRRLTERLGLL